jgi:hypothetical protein
MKAIYSVSFDGEHLIACRRDGRPMRVVWDVLQQIKDEHVGPDVTMVEVYPARRDLVNDVNWRHLWVVSPDELPEALRRRWYGLPST